MTKADVIDAVANRGGLTKRQAGEVVESVLDSISDALERGDRVNLPPFGSFVVRTRAAREGRNPKTGAKIEIAARTVPAFMPGSALKTAVARGTARR